MMLTIKQIWRQEIQQALGKDAPALFDIRIDKHQKQGLGHYSSPILLEIAATLGQSPMPLGLKLKRKIASCVAVSAPGFLNFHCQADELWRWLLLFRPQQLKYNQDYTAQSVYQQRRLDLLLRPFKDIGPANLSDCLALGEAEFGLGLLVMDAVDTIQMEQDQFLDKTRLLLIDGLDDYFNQMVFLSEHQPIVRARHHLLGLIRDFL